MVLLVVDAQKGIVDERLYAFKKFVSNIRKLIGTARERGIEVLYVQHDEGRAGETVACGNLPLQKRLKIR